MRAQEMKNRTAEALIAARENLASFGRLTDRRFELPRHIQRTIEVLEKVERGEINRAMLYMPPRHGKSFLSSYLFPAWYLGRHPDRSIIAASYGQQLASDFGGRVRNVM